MHFERRPFPGQHSIERLFVEIRRHFPEDIQSVSCVCPHFSRGFWPRLANVHQARRKQTEVNHVVGDSHYLALGLNASDCVLTIHDCASFLRLKGWKRAVFRWLWHDWPMRRARVVTVVSESTRRELEKYVGIGRGVVRVIPNCVRREFARSPKAFNEVEPVVLQVGTGWNKNVGRVAEALSGLRCRWVIIGEVSQRLRGVLDDCGVPWRHIPRATDQQVLQAYRDSDVVVFASLYEGFGLPIIEAQATGRPVVTSDRLSMPEVACGAALLVDPLDVSAIRAAVVRVFRDRVLRRDLVEAGFENVKRFEAARVAEAYAQIYREVAR